MFFLIICYRLDESRHLFINDSLKNDDFVPHTQLKARTGGGRVCSHDQFIVEEHMAYILPRVIAGENKHGAVLAWQLQQSHLASYANALGQ